MTRKDRDTYVLRRPEEGINMPSQRTGGTPQRVHLLLDEMPDRTVCGRVSADVAYTLEIERASCRNCVSWAPGMKWRGKPQPQAKEVAMSAGRSDAVIAEATTLLDRIAVYPGERWPDYWDVERALLNDSRLHEDCPWTGGTLGAAHFIAAAPRLVRDLLAVIAAQREEFEQYKAAVSSGGVVE